MKIGNYECVNESKVIRAIEGTMGPAGKLADGVGENASDAEKLAAYDRLGGLITLNGNKVKTGSFWDFDKKKPVADPQPILIFRDLSGEIVEVPEGESLPIEVKAAQIAKKNKEEKEEAEEDAPKKKRAKK